MCLDSVTKTVTLKKDKVVWKCVAKKVTYEFGKQIGEYAEYKHFGKRYNYALRRKHTSIKKRKITCLLDGSKYVPHFHVFLNKKEARMWNYSAEICNYIIPQGTEVIYGGLLDYECIVTPILINPRVPEAV